MTLLASVERVVVVLAGCRFGDAHVPQYRSYSMVDVECKAHPAYGGCVCAT